MAVADGIDCVAVAVIVAAVVDVAGATTGCAPGTWDLLITRYPTRLAISRISKMMKVRTNGRFLNFEDILPHLEKGIITIGKTPR